MAGYTYSQFSSSLIVRKSTSTGEWDYELLDKEAEDFEEMAVPVFVSVIMGEFLDEVQMTTYGRILLKHNILQAPSTVFIGTYGQLVATKNIAESMTTLPPEWAAYQGGIFFERKRVNKQLNDGKLAFRLCLR